jgi:ubiquinone/menaquinone biosynthesis C-methylase UbiE
MLAFSRFDACELACSEMNLYSLLSHPSIYSLSQTILAPGAHRRLSALLSELLTEIDPGSKVLDVGCGPSSWLAPSGIRAVGSDISERYIRKYSESGQGPAVVNSADTLPFASHCFDSVWSVALIHHLPDDVAKKALTEMVRVCKPGGYVIIMDAVMPRSALANPLSYILRRLDRGRYVRQETELLDLYQRTLPSPKKVIRMTITDNGLEALWCWAKVA